MLIASIAVIAGHMDYDRMDILSHNMAKENVTV